MWKGRGMVWKRRGRENVLIPSTPPATGLQESTLPSDGGLAVSTLVWMFPHTGSSKVAKNREVA